MLDSPVAMKDSDHLAVWMYLLLNATHKEVDMLFNGARITLLPGQLITGRKSISSKTKVNESKVQRILKTFEIEQQIEQQNGNKNRLISIKNWDNYQQYEQQNEQQLNNNRTTTEQQLNTNKNVKNVKNVKNKNIYGAYKHVRLTDDEREELALTYGEDMTLKLITHLDEYIEMKGYQAKSHYLAIKKWVIKAVSEEQPKSKVVPISKNNNFNNFTQRDYDMVEFERAALMKK